MPQEAQCSISQRAARHCRQGRGVRRGPQIHSSREELGGVARARQQEGEGGAGAWLPTSRRVVLI